MRRLLPVSLGMPMPGLIVPFSRGVCVTDNPETFVALRPTDDFCVLAGSRPFSCHGMRLLHVAGRQIAPETPPISDQLGGDSRREAVEDVTVHLC